MTNRYGSSAAGWGRDVVGKTQSTSDPRPRRFDACIEIIIAGGAERVHGGMRRYKASVAYALPQEARFGSKLGGPARAER